MLGLLLLFPRASTLRKTRFAVAASLLLCGFFSLAAWAHWQDQQFTTSTSASQTTSHAVHGCKTTYVARTDLGRPILLQRVEKSAGYRGALEQEERQLSGKRFGSTFRRTADPSPESNCHGWVFADGRYWISGEDVDSILQDNEYAQVSTPQVDDLIVYRTSDAISHVGIVRTVSTDGFVVVESKWGSKGRFLHAPQDQPYWHSWNFYRSPRQGHQLKGVEDPPAQDSPSKLKIVSLPNTNREG